MFPEPEAWKEPNPEPGVQARLTSRAVACLLYATRQYRDVGATSMLSRYTTLLMIVKASKCLRKSIPDSFESYTTNICSPGDQHKSNGNATANPFEEVKPVISEYTAQEIATLQSRLNKRLGPEYISTRAGPGNSRVAYLSAEKAINLANEVFGFNGWSSSIQNIQIDFVDENPTKGTLSIGLSVVVRVTLKDGTYHEDTGYGGIENCKSKIAAFEKAKKEGTTDALKRALRNFGNVLGNCVYDKDYITKVSKVKAGQAKWDVNELYRHNDFMSKEEADEKKINPSIPQRQPSVPMMVPEDSFDVNDFDEDDFVDIPHQDGVVMPQPQRGQPPHHSMTPSKPPQIRPNPQVLPQLRAQQAPAVHLVDEQGQQPAHIRQNPQISNGHAEHAPSRSSSPGIASQHFAAPQPQSGPQVVGFFSAKAADKLDGNNNPTGNTPVSKFNPYSESPSIRKTSGVDHSKSAALNRQTLKPEPQIAKEDEAPRLPAEQARRVGHPTAPGLAMSPGLPRMTTKEYRPPTRHGPVERMASGGAGNNQPHTAAKRAPLGDLSNVQHPGMGVPESGGDVKRQRIGPGLSGNAENKYSPAPG